MGIFETLAIVAGLYLSAFVYHRAAQ